MAVGIAAPCPLEITPRNLQGVPLSKLAAGERPIKRVAKFMNPEGLMKELQVVIVGIRHNGVVTGDHNQREPKRFSMFSE